MNELCDYISAWEKRRLLWDHSAADNRDILLNHRYALADRGLLRTIRHTVNDYNIALKALFSKLSEERTESDYQQIRLLAESYRQKLLVLEGISSEEELANYVIKVCYSNFSISKQLAWSSFGDYILKNLRENSPKEASYTIQESDASEGGIEYLGKYYQISKEESP